MKYNLLLFLTLFVLSCNRFSHNKADGSNLPDSEITDTMNHYEDNWPMTGVDSIAVTYWMTQDACDYIYTYSEGQMKINRASSRSPFEKHIFNKNTINKFVGSVDSFFITKSERIELNRSKRNPIVTDYPCLTIELFFEGKLINKEMIQYGEEGYDIEYNPKLVAFFDLLDSIISSSYVYRYRTDIIDEEPRFGKGGIEAFAKWVESRVNYVNPEAELTGAVVLQFVVNTDGSVSDIEILRSLDPEFDNEAIRVVSGSPKWSPGKNKGEAVNVSFILPVYFQVR